MAVFRGTSGDNTISGSAGDDNFLLWQGGNDTVDGGGGNDIFRMGAALNAGDKIDGGTGEDVIALKGDYSAGLVFSADTITNIEIMGLAGGHSYNLTLNDGNVAAGDRLLVKAQTLGAGDQLTFDGSAETDGKFYIVAGAGDDTLTGGAKHDVFDLSHGGNDTAHGGGGNDTFLLGGAFTASDAIDGGTGDDTLELNGDYSGGFFLGATTFTNIDTLRLDAGHSYGFASNDGNVASGATLTVDASALGSGDTVAFVGSAETDGSFHFEAGAGSNYFIGGAGNDVFDLTQGTNSGATAEGGGGNDVFNVGADFNRYGGGLGSGLAGGDGDDTLNIDGAYATTIQLSTAAFFVDSIETVTFGGGHSYDAQLHGDIATGASLLTLDGSTLGAGDTLSIDMTAGTSSAYAISGGAGNDSFILSGSGANSVTGGLGADHITCGAGTDTIFTGAGADSTGAGGYDTIDAFNFDTDKFDLAGAHTVSQIDTTFAFVDSATFDANLAAASAGQMADDGVLFVVVTSGDLAGHGFMVVDVNNDGLYQAGTDYVFDMIGATGTSDTGDFI